VKNPFRKLTGVLNGPDDYPSNKAAHPVFIAGIKYPSLFRADIDSGIRAASIWKAMRRSGGGPVQITPINGTTKIITNRKSVLVVMEVWVTARTTGLQKKYDL
jgi:hypothetical protein